MVLERLRECESIIGVEHFEQLMATIEPNVTQKLKELILNQE